MSETVTHADLHEPANDPSTLNIAPGVTLTDLQRRHVALVLDLFQGKGTMAKINENFDDEVVYEDHFATARNKEEFAGQLLNIPVVTSSTHTNSYEVNSNEPSSIQNGKGVSVHCDEIHVAFNHDLTFKAPLPKSAKTITLDTTLHIYSDARTGKIVQLKDRPQKEIEDRGLIPDFIRRLNSVIAPKAGLPQNEKEDAEHVLKHER